ncbi:unnamed protein product [Arabidopsis halleri]
MSAKKVDGLSAPAIRRDPYKVLSVPKDANDQEINSAYRNLSLNNLGVPIKTSVNVNV